jgi:alpha,alpha-trehalase
MMVDDHYRATGDREWLESMIQPVIKEYRFWMRERITDTGLNRYASRATAREKIDFYDQILVPRLKFPGAAGLSEKEEAGGHYLAEAESGMDFTPRFAGRCADHLPVDLNANLFLYEKLIARWTAILGGKDGAEWELRAGNRVRLMRRLMREPETGLFHDYDLANGRRSPELSLALFFPLFAAIAEERDVDAAVAALPRFVVPHGLATCPKTRENGCFQWDWPIVWPPLQFVVCRALFNYGRRREAVAVATAYCRAVEKQFRETGGLWEKYDGMTGCPAEAEYEASSFLGWTAGTYLACRGMIAANKR